MTTTDVPPFQMALPDHLCADRLGGDVQKWLDDSVMTQDTAETERDPAELGGEG